MNARQVVRETVTGIADADNQHYSEGKNSYLPRTFAQLGVERRHWNGPQLGWRRSR